MEDLWYPGCIQKSEGKWRFDEKHSKFGKLNEKFEIYKIFAYILTIHL